MSHDQTAIVERLIRVEEKLDAFLFRSAADSALLATHDARIRQLENSGAKLLGMASVVAVFAGLGSDSLLSLFTG